MANARVHPFDPSELTSLCDRLRDEQVRLQSLLGEAERALKDLKGRNRRSLAIASPSTDLDHVTELVAVTEDLRSENGNLCANAIADAFGVSINQLAKWLGRTRQALSKTPAADSIQIDLACYERISRLRAVLPPARFLKWLRMRHQQLENQSPLEVIAAGEGEAVADLVEDMLTGSPT